jgi:3-oxoadipate enol-lactonase
MQVTQANGIHIHFREAGNPSGQALVFSNSLGTDFRVWEPIVGHFTATCRIILYDKRGHGLSDTPPEPYAMQDHVNDLLGLLDAVGIESAIVCGLSVGGMIAQALAATEPAQVKALVLACTAHRIGTKTVWDERIDTVRNCGIAGVADAVLERWFSADFRARRAEEFIGWRNMLVRSPVEGYIGTCAAIRDADLTEAARSIGAPTLCISATEDGSTPPDLVQSLSELIPGSRLKSIPGAAHIACVESPDAFVQTMGTFMNEANLV